MEATADLLRYWQSPRAVLADREFYQNIDFERLAKHGVRIAGCGSVGSKVALELARLGVRKFVLYDPDIVKAENLPFQAFDDINCGDKKITVLADALTRVNKMVKTNVTHAKYDGTVFNPDTITICSADSWLQRRACAKNYRLSRSLYIDARTGPTQAEVMALALDHRREKWAMKEFETSIIHTDVNNGGCPLQTSILSSSMASVLTVQAFIEWARGGAITLWRYVDFERGVFHHGGLQRGEEST